MKSFYLNDEVKVSTLTSSDFKLTEDEWNTILRVILSGRSDGVEDMIALSEIDRVKEIISHDILINSIFNCMLSPKYSCYDLDTSDIHKLRISYLDMGWDYYVDALKESIYYITSPDSDDKSTLIKYLNKLKTINLFEYYDQYATNMRKELESIFGSGWVQEVYLGFDGDSLWIGFDIANGSIIAPMPIGGNPLFVFECDQTKYSSTVETLILTKPGRFYGKGQDHFYDTEKGCCYNCHIDIRLD